MSDNAFEKMLKDALGGNIEVLDIGGPASEQAQPEQEEEMVPYPKERRHGWCHGR